MAWKFSQWNALFLDRFFNPANAGKPVRLAVDAEFLDREGSAGGGVEGFLTAIYVGPEWLTADDHFDKTLQSRWLAAARHWPHAGINQPRPAIYETLHPRMQPWQRTPPPFLPYVGLCAYAWTLEPELHANNFFHRLELAYPGHASATLNWTKPYWEALRRWSSDADCMNGERGLFRATHLLGGNLYTGLALSQVLLRATHVERLPEVFDVAGLAPNVNMSPDELGNRLSAVAGRLVPLLGKSLCDVLAGQADRLRPELLDAIHEAYKEWDGEVERRRVQARRDVAGDDDAAEYSRIPLRLVLLHRKTQVGADVFESRITVSAAYWGGRQFFITDETSESDWAAAPSALDSSCLCFARQGNAGTEFLGGERILDGCPVVTGHEGDEQPVEFRYRCKDIRFLQWGQIGREQVLIEVDGGSCKTSEYLYILVRTNSTGWESLRQWRTANPEAWHAIDAAVDGAKNWRTFAINLAEVPKATSIPLVNEIWPSQPTTRLFSLVGGERVRSRQYGLHRYFIDDLPLIVALPGVALRVVGAGVRPVPLEAQPDDLPGRGTSPSLHEIEPSADSDRIEILAIRGHDESYTRAIKIYRGRVDSDLPENDFALDEFGRRASRANAAAGRVRFQGIELSGPETPPPGESHNGYRLQADDSNRIAEHERRDNVGLELYEALRNGAANTGRMRYAEFRRHVGRLYAGAPATYVAEALRDAAVIDIETDHTNRWTYVHPRIASLCRLPTLNQGRTEFLVTGCYTRAELSRLHDTAAAYQLPIEQLSPRGFGGKRVPAMASRRTVPCADDSLADWMEAARQAGWSVPQGVPAEYLIAHAGDMSRWCELRLKPGWHTYAALEPEQSEFPPDGSIVNNVSFQLESATDSLTESHRCYQLIDVRDAIRRYASVTEPEWAKWFCWTMREPRNLAMPQPGVPGVNGRYMELVLPGCLPLPPLFARAMVLCSGYPAVHTGKSGPPWPRDPQFAGLPDGLVAYTGVPKALSDAMFRKLGYS